MTNVRSTRRITHHMPRSGALWLPPFLLLPVALLGPNTALVLLACLVLAVGLKLLWRPGEPPILLFIFLIQWLQSAAGAIYANSLGVPLSRLPDAVGTLFPPDAPYSFAAGLMLISALVLAISMRAGVGRPIKDINERLKAAIQSRKFSFWLITYLAVWLFASLFSLLAPMAGGLRLPFLALGELKWAGFMLLTFAAFLNHGRLPRLIWLVAFLLEVALGFGGFFSDFKTPIFYSLIAFFAIGFRFRFSQVLIGTSLVITALGLSIVWTAIKEDYREFASGGLRQQVVTVSYGESIDEIGRLVAELDQAKLSYATGSLVRRVMYHQFFGVTTSRVPEYLPHAGGEIWGEAISRPFMPRLLFPDKRAINDSDLTNQYTGLRVAGADQGTSISIGYMAEAYVDFGPLLMFAPIAILGASIGFLNRWLLWRRGIGALIGAALAPYALMPAHLAETSILKMASSLVLTFMICFLIIKFLIPIMVRQPRKRHFA